MTPIGEGDELPDFTLPAVGSRTVLSRAELLGRRAILFIYPKAGTSGCTTEAREFSALAAEFEASDTRVVGLSPDARSALERFREKEKLAVDLVADEEKTLLSALGLWGEKQMYGRTYMGAERATIFVDADGTVRRIWRKVRVAGHAAEVLEATRALAGSEGVP